MRHAARAGSRRPPTRHRRKPVVTDNKLRRAIAFIAQRLMVREAAARGKVVPEQVAQGRI
ncbi:hypothetical protein GE253_24230 [Niveispirillum sp. SYP-B3756]|nr:hypothetical protein [Niveispirillum sp. SYP-B3756]